MKFLQSVSQSQEPVAYGALATALLELVVVFAPRFGLALTQPEQVALGALVLAIVAVFTRAQVQPVPDPAPTPAAPQPPAAA